MYLFHLIFIWLLTYFFQKNWLHFENHLRKKNQETIPRLIFLAKTIKCPRN